MKRNYLITSLILITALFFCGVFLTSNTKNSNAINASSRQGLPTFTAYRQEHFVISGAAGARSITRLADSVLAMDDHNIIVDLSGEEPGVDFGGIVTVIATNAFNAVGNIIRVTLPETLITINNNAFRDNMISSIIIPNSVTTIGASAFRDNFIKEVVIPDGVLSIGNDSFRNNVIENLTIGSGITTISQAAFHTNRISNLVVPETVDIIGIQAFMNGLDNATVTFEYGIQEIRNQAFDSRGLEQTNGRRHGVTGTVFIPKSVTLIGTDAFNDNAINEIIFEPRVTTGLNPDSYLDISNHGFRNNPVVNLWIGDGVRSIGDGAFRSLFYLETVFIPQSVETIGANAFARTFNAAQTAQTVATIFIEGHTSTSAPQGWAVNAFPSSSSPNSHTGKIENILVWEATRTVTVTIEHIGGRTSTHTLSIGASFTPTLDHGRVTNVTINGTALASTEWEKIGLNTRNFTLDLSRICNDLEIVIHGDRIWDITFANHYEINSINTDVYNGEGLVLPDITMTRAGYTFGGWYVNDVLRQAGETVSNITSNMTITARWDAYSLANNGNDFPWLIVGIAVGTVLLLGALITIIIVKKRKLS